MATRRPTTYDVRIWDVSKIERTRPSAGATCTGRRNGGGGDVHTTYRLRWSVAGE